MRLGKLVEVGSRAKCSECRGLEERRAFSRDRFSAEQRPLVRHILGIGMFLAVLAASVRESPDHHIGSNPMPG